MLTAGKKQQEWEKRIRWVDLITVGAAKKKKKKKRQLSDSPLPPSPEDVNVKT